MITLEDCIFTETSVECESYTLGDSMLLTPYLMPLFASALVVISIAWGVGKLLRIFRDHAK